MKSSRLLILVTCLTVSMLPGLIASVMAQDAAEPPKVAPDAAEAPKVAPDEVAPPKGPDAELFEKITDMLQKRIEPAATEEETKKKLQEHLTQILTLCDEYLAKFPEGAQILDVCSFRVQVKFAMGQVAEDKAAIEKAVQETEKLVDDNPGKVEVEGLRALLFQHFMETEQVDKAVGQLKKFIETTKDERAARSARIVLYQVEAQRGNYEEAKNALKTIMEKYADSPEAEYAAEALKKLERIGKPMELSYTSIEGKEISVADYKGKVLLIDCWASWCGPCREEMPNVVKLYSERKKDGFEIIGISFDLEKQAMLDYQKEAGMTWPQYFDGKGWENALRAKLDVESIPATFLVDRQGNLRAMDLRGEVLAKQVDALLKEEKKEEKKVEEKKAE